MDDTRTNNCQNEESLETEKPHIRNEQNENVQEKIKGNSDRESTNVGGKGTQLDVPKPSKENKFSNEMTVRTNGTEEKSPDVSGFRNFAQILAVFGYVFCGLLLAPMMIAIMLILSSYSKICFALSLIYVGWIFWDRDAPYTTKRRQEWFRNSQWWKYHKEFFPVRLHKTADLPPEKNYLFAGVPHGVFCISFFSSFLTNAHRLDLLFPGIKTSVSTLSVIFYLPIFRDMLLWLGGINPTRKVLYNLLGGPDTGNAVVLIVGGAAEALYSKPGSYKTLVKKRKGFCRMALETGCDLVPVLSFGETDLYDVSQATPGTTAYKIQQFVKKVTGVMAVLPVGGLMCGFLPKRKSINVVVGAPISVEKKSEITETEVTKLHEKFIASLVQLFHDNKHFLEDPNSQLEFAAR